MKSNSWIIVSLETGKGVMETWNAGLASVINKKKYKLVPADEYLCALNAKIKLESK